MGKTRGESRLTKLLDLMETLGKQLNTDGTSVYALRPIILDLVDGKKMYNETLELLNEQERIMLANLLYYLLGFSNIEMLKYKLFDIKPSVIIKENELGLFNLSNLERDYHEGDLIYVFSIKGSRLFIFNTINEVTALLNISAATINNYNPNEELQGKFILRFKEE